MILNFMASTHLKKFGTRPCLPLCGIPSSFYNSLQTSGDGGDKLLKFRNRNVVPFLSNTGFKLLNCLRSSLSHLPLYDAPNVFYGWKIWTAGWPFQYPDPSSTQPWSCNWCSMWSGIVMLENARSSLKEMTSGWEHMLFYIFFAAALGELVILFPSWLLRDTATLRGSFYTQSCCQLT